MVWALRHDSTEAQRRMQQLYYRREARSKTFKAKTWIYRSATQKNKSLVKKLVTALQSCIMLFLPSFQYIHDTHTWWRSLQVMALWWDVVAPSWRHNSFANAWFPIEPLICLRLLCCHFYAYDFSIVSTSTKDGGGTLIPAKKERTKCDSLCLPKFTSPLGLVILKDFITLSTMAHRLWVNVICWKQFPLYQSIK